MSTSFHLQQNHCFISCLDHQSPPTNPQPPPSLSLLPAFAPKQFPSVLYRRAKVIFAKWRSNQVTLLREILQWLLLIFLKIVTQIYSLASAWLSRAFCGCAPHLSAFWPHSWCPAPSEAGLLNLLLPLPRCFPSFCFSNKLLLTLQVSPWPSLPQKNLSLSVSLGKSLHYRLLQLDVPFYI